MTHSDTDAILTPLDIIGHWKIKNGVSNMDVIIFFVVSMGMASVLISLDYMVQLMSQKNNRTKISS